MIEAHNVTKKFHDGSQALKKVSFLIERGEFVFFVGHSGAGKSTLFKMFIKELVPTSGTLKVFGREVSSLRGKQVSVLRRNIGIVFQDFRLLEEKTLYDNIAFAMRAAGATPKEMKKVIPQVLEQVGLKNKIFSKVGELSGGELQRVGIARAISNRPNMIVADEPTGNLDPKTSMEIINLLRSINIKGTTVLVATHDQHIVDELKKRVIYLENGQLVGDEAKGAYARVL